MHAGLVAHGELPHVARLVGKLAVELPLGLAERGAQRLVEVGDEALAATHQVDEVGGIVRYAPAVGVGVVLVVVVARP